MLKDETFEALYNEQLRDLYDAEEQIVAALPDLIRAVSSPELKSAFSDHLQQSRQHLLRLQEVFVFVADDHAGRNICEGMRALLAESRLLTNQYAPSPVLDVALIAAAQQVEHYEICAYGTAAKLAQMLAHEPALALLRRTLKEEKEMDNYLSDIAETLLMGEELEDAELAEAELAS